MQLLYRRTSPRMQGAYAVHLLVPEGDQVKCPYRECDYEGNELEVDDHVRYMTTVVNDREHQERELRERRNS